MLGSRKPLTRKRALTFVLDGEPRTVDIGAPMPVERDGRWMVPLMDLWVATMLPGDIFDLTFRVVTGGGTESELACLTDGMIFAQGFIDIATRQLWWGDAGASSLVGARPASIVVSTRVQEPRPRAAAVRLVPRPEPRNLSVLELRRLLPVAATRYPAVVWRDVTRVGQSA